MPPLIADLHIHSAFSRATSKRSLLPDLSAWAQVKGIDIVGTGDFTHPGWQAHLREHLEPATEPGLFQLRDPKIAPALPGIVPTPRATRFMLTAEISGIYKKHGQVRKIHNLIFAPDFESVTRISAALAAIGNIESDGRPILGLDSRDLLEIVLEKAPGAYLIPAHVWTPWFSLFGSKSGFDAIEECFEDLAPHIFALETGLSSDPEMNRLISALDRFTLISNSDCHSPNKLGREANFFTTEADFFAIRAALENPAQGFHGTVEFFPEEGKYHLDGHRKCGVRWEPSVTREHQGICPECGKPLTVGVLNRVMELADRDAPKYPANTPVVHSLIPLPEVVGEMLGCGPDTKKAQAWYGDLIQRFGSEFEILLRAPLEKLREEHSPVLAEAIGRMRAGKVIREGGYDGEYGVIRVFGPGEREEFLGQSALFAQAKPSAHQRPARKRATPKPRVEAPATLPREADPEQQAAITHPARHVLVNAGPGSGKTYTLVGRLTHWLQHGQADPTRVAAITFTRRAAGEIRQRLREVLGEASDAVFVGTFHAFALHWLRHIRPDLSVVDETGRELALKNAFPDGSQREMKSALTDLEAYFFDRNAGSLDPEKGEALEIPPSGEPAPEINPVEVYLDALSQQNAVDLEDVIPALLDVLATDMAVLPSIRQAVSWLAVDEFQDLNHAQYRLVALLAETSQVFAIGDPNQAIYGFRAADWRYFLRFSADFTATSLQLRRNYRTQATILHAAQAVIAAPLEATRAAGAPILWFQAENARQEAEWIAARVAQLVGGTSHRELDESARPLGFAEVAVLYRLRQQAEPLFAALDARGIPVQMVGAKPFFMAAPLRPLYWLIRAAADPGALEHLFLAGLQSGVGKTALRQLEQATPLACADFFEQVPMDAKLAARLNPLRESLAAFREQVAAGDLAVALAETQSWLDLPRNSDDARRFVQLAGAFGRDLSGFAEHLHHQTEATAYDPRAEAVPLMTLHAAKGLEFPAVFIAGVETGILPWPSGDAEEERRLFYVGITRAQHRLFMTSAAQRGSHQPRPSPFLDNLTLTIEKPKAKPVASPQLALF